jgi:hypothetical protein
VESGQENFQIGVQSIHTRVGWCIVQLLADKEYIDR